ncbi:HAD-like protein [Myriangium duriaei CBS 260.36]|uniref:HAD-like protein n=1 Tax=Myriangium duriaei CBS 260.36 TaxID=1168546 RepID=A0A9P4IX91_9PEZI|nr:HAD-like protein [Myriangium duriaei CBS 260.36]
MAPPKVILFDIGGVCVISPMSAIASYERNHSIPPGYINTAISSTSPNGSWQRLERGEIPLDASFFSSFQRDLRNPDLWRRYYAKSRPDVPVPPVPEIDAEGLFWTMMTVSRAPDPYIYPALRRLRQVADETGEFVVAACSNTSIFPPGHVFNDPSTPEGKFNAELKGSFHLFVSSAHVGMRKPERSMYELTLRECERVAREKGVIGKEERLNPGEVLFLDDIGGNLRGAREVGIKGVKVVMGKTEDAVRELERVVGVQLSGEKKARL